MRNLIKKIIKEELKKDKTITCNNCGWSWKLSEAGNDPFNCHKCLSNNNQVTIKEETKEKYPISIGDVFRVNKENILIMIESIKCNPKKARVMTKHTIFGNHEIFHDGCDVYYLESRDGGETWHDDNEFKTELNWIPVIISNGHWKLLHGGSEDIGDFFPE